MNAYEWGKKHESCILEERKKFDKAHPGEGQAGFYKYWNRGDHLIWQLNKLPSDIFATVADALERALLKIVERSIRNHALNCGVREVEQWAAKWISGEDRSAEMAASAASAASAARAASASWAALAASAAWAASAVRAAELKLQAEDIRREIPEWPGTE